MHLHLLRVGAVGQLGRFRAVELVRYPRETRVVVRTERGLEIGTVLTTLDDTSADPNDEPADGSIIRRMTVADELLAARLDSRRLAALEGCQERLVALGFEAVLMDVEHLFDGTTLVFYFLGPVDERLSAVIDELAATYDARAQFQAFAEAVVAGCGPDCGTESAAGCGSCSTGCAVAAACHGTRH